MHPPHPVETIPGDPGRGLLLICDHASNHVPEDLAQLGVPEHEFSRHIAYDIGAAGVTRHLAERLGVPAILTRFSRLIIDPNRGRADPTLVMRLSDGAVVPGNARIDEAGKAERIRRFYAPFDTAIAAGIAAAEAVGTPPPSSPSTASRPIGAGCRAPGRSASCGIATTG